MSKQSAAIPSVVASIQSDRGAAGKRVPYMRLLSGALGSIFLGQALVYLFAGEQLAGFLGHHYDPHVYQELSMAYIAVSLGSFLGALRPNRMQAAIYTTVPLALLLGGLGLVDMRHSENLASSIPHFIEAALAVGLLILWLRQGVRERA